jgi:hypothetical protein
MSTVLFRRQGDQVCDAAGVPLSGGSLSYFRAGTSTLQTTYSDAAGTVANTNPVVLNSAGRLITPVYLGDSYDYKELLKDSTGATVDPWPFDNIPKAVATASSANFAYPQIPWTPKTSGFSVAADDAGKGYECDTSSANIAVTLVSAATIGSGKGVWFKKIAAANSVTLTPSGSETIDGKTSLVLTGAYDCVGIFSDGASWFAVTWVKNDRLLLSQITTPSAPPSGTDLLYVKSGDVLALQNSSGVEKQFGKDPTVQTFTSGTAATYTPATGAVRIRVRMVGGGGGGGSALSGSGTAGNTTSFQGSASGVVAWTALGGGYGSSAPGAGGTGGADGTGTKVVRLNGGRGSTGVTSGTNIGGSGGGTVFGSGAPMTVAPSAGSSPAANTGGGGSGGGQSGSGDGGGGGGGEYVEFWVTASQLGSTATYTVAATASGAPAGGQAGGAGAAGLIIIEEFYH